MVALNIDLTRIQAIFDNANDDSQLFRAIVNAPFEQRVPAAFLFLGIVVLLQVNPETKTIDRIALSDTELAKNTTDVSVVPFEEIKIPVGYQSNIIAEAIASNQPTDTTDWEMLFTPALNGEQARINQASAGVAYSAVRPLQSRQGGALIFSYFQHELGLSEPQRQFMAAYAKLVDEYLDR